MRRSTWLVVAMLLIASWAWSRHMSHGTDDGQATTAAASPSGNKSQAAGRHAPLSTLPVASRHSISNTDASVDDGRTYPGFLPPEARETLRLIRHGSPYPYRQDGGTFQNRENALPRQARGYYREYTVRTPGSRDRGARRLVTGGNPPSEYFYTDDHYRSFRRFTLEPPR